MSASSLDLREVPRLTAAGVLSSIRENIRPSWFDRAIATVSPARGVERMKSKAMLAMGGWTGVGSFPGGNSYTGAVGGGGYTSARVDRRAMRTWKTRNNSADADVIFDLAKLRDRSRDLGRNSPIAVGAIGTVVQNVIGTGLQLQSQIDADTLKLGEDAAIAWQTKTEREFRLFAESTECDLTRTQNLYGLQELVFLSALESGDVVALMPMTGTTDRIPYKLRIQIIEADRLCNPKGMRDTAKFCGGVEMDDNGAPTAYHIMRHHPGSIDRTQVYEWDTFQAFGTKTKRRNVLHLYKKTRPGQTRGVPYLAPVIETIKQLDRYTEAEIMGTVIAAMLTVFIKTTNDDGLAPTLPSLNQGDQNNPPDEVGLGTGAVVELNPGESIETVNPGRPNSGYDPFVRSIVQEIGIALGLPFEVLIKHFTASYSASRAALLDAWRFFRNRRQWVSDGFCQPIYEAWLDEAVSIGRIAAPGYFDNAAIRQAYLQANWLGDSPMQIDPVKEAEGAAKRMDIGVSTLTQETMALTGGIFTDNLRVQQKEREARVKAGLINSTTQVSGPTQKETINVDQGGIPNAADNKETVPVQVPAAQPGGGGASPRPSQTKEPQKPGGAKPAETPSAPPAKTPNQRAAARAAKESQARAETAGGGDVEDETKGDLENETLREGSD